MEQLKRKSCQRRLDRLETHKKRKKTGDLISNRYMQIKVRLKSTKTQPNPAQVEMSFAAAESAALRKITFLSKEKAV